MPVMNYFAILRPGSAVHRMWREKSQLSGVLEHVHFFWRASRYESNELTAEEVSRLTVRGAADTQLEAMGVVPDEPEDAEEEQSSEEDRKPNRSRIRTRL